jgi:hypothetical protein
MKALLFSPIALVGLLLIGLQHQQLGQLRDENVMLQQASAEADQLKADLEKSTGNEAQDAAEIDRLREENRDLLKLRNEVNQLRDTRVQFEKVSAENRRLLLVARSAPRPQTKDAAMKPILIRVDNLSNRGLNTPEDTLQTFYWALRDGNNQTLQRCLTPHFSGPAQVDGIVSIEIVARRDVDATTVQLGIQIQEAPIPEGYDSFRHVIIPARQAGPGRKFIVTLILQGGEWRLDASTY